MRTPRVQVDLTLPEARSLADAGDWLWSVAERQAAEEAGYLFANVDAFANAKPGEVRNTHGTSK